MNFLNYKFFLKKGKPEYRIIINMIERKIQTEIIRLASEYSVILIQGPRQSGKTTLCRMLFPEKPYFSLEEPDIRSRAEQDPRGFLSSVPDGAVLDEVQRVPSLLSYIQRIVDEKKKKGMFILTGSSNLLLSESVSQSLAGRVAIFRLLPLSFEEASELQSGWSAESMILNGFYPQLLNEKMSRSEFYRNYVNTYVERDIRTILKIKDYDNFRRFLVSVASRIGTNVDLTAISSESGVSTKTVSEWLSVLEQSFICYRLPPYFVNRTKRLVKTPKLYFYDTGVACSVLGIENEEQLSSDRLRGSLFENMIISDMLKRKYNSNSGEDYYFYRTSDGIEVDAVRAYGRKLYPIEIKMSSTFDPSWAKGLNVFLKEYEDSAASGCIVYGGEEEFQFRDIEIRTYRKYWA